MGEWSEYFEQFPDEDPSKQPRTPLEDVRAKIDSANRERAMREGKAPQPPAAKPN